MYFAAFIPFKSLGFADGSAIGSLDHELNNAGAGFMNAVYLLRKSITDAGKRLSYIATMKWYNDFGEVYQDPFEYAGTTADRMRTISLFRYFYKHSSISTHVSLKYNCIKTIIF